MSNLAYTMLATLGGQAQVITFALDDLLRRGFSIHEVLVLHLMPPANVHRVRQAMERLQLEFSANIYAGQPCRLEFIPLRAAGERLDDIRNNVAANAAWGHIYTLISELKAQGQHLHVCISGGRRMMALLAMSAAMINFDFDDCLWHMYTPKDFLARARDGAIMHAQAEDGVRLVKVPLAPWGAFLPGLRALTQLAPLDAVAAQTQQLEADTRQRCQAVVAQLTPRQLETLQAFAAGQNPQEVAETLYVTVKTVHAHKTAILSECRNAWELPDAARLTYHFLREKFGGMGNGEWRRKRSG